MQTQSLVAALHWPFKYVADLKTPGKDELYDLSADPTERVDLQDQLRELGYLE